MRGDVDKRSVFLQFESLKRFPESRYTNHRFRSQWQRASLKLVERENLGRRMLDRQLKLIESTTGFLEAFVLIPKFFM